MPYKLFISYTREKNDFNAVTFFRKHLLPDLKVKTGQKDLDVFLDVDITAGMDWENKLLTELDKADCLLVLLSPLWLNSEYCLKEYHHYRNKGGANRKIVPVLWDEVFPNTLNEQQAVVLNELQKFQMHDWTKTKSYSWGHTKNKLAMSKLSADIRKLLQD